MDDDARRTAPGLGPGGGVAPGETPPAEGSTPQAVSDQPPAGRSAGVNRSRLPMWITLIALGIMVLGFLAYFVTSIVGYNRDGGLDEQGLRPPAAALVR